MSLDAFQLSVRPVCVTFDGASPVGCVGGVVSPEDAGGGGGGSGEAEHSLVDAVSWPFADEFPAASRATTPNAYAVPQARPVWAVVVVVTVATFELLRYTS